MADKGRFIVDETISQEQRDDISEKVLFSLDKMKSEVAERTTKIQKRQDFYEGKHHKWTNVQGQAVKQQEGHILAVFNYVLRFCQKLQQTLTNNPPRLKIKSKDEANEIETSRAEAVEEVIYEILRKNFFFSVIFKRSAVNQIRDGDFMIECKVMKDIKGPRVVINSNEDLTKIKVGWDDASGTSYSFIAFEDDWSTQKILRDYGYEAEPMTDSDSQKTTIQGDHLKDQYGIMSSGGSTDGVPSGETQLPKAHVTDYWGYHVINSRVKVCNLIFINKKLVQFVATDYKEIPKFVGHSLVVAGKPWSMGFIDPLVDPQIELNDRTGEEGDLIRVGSHMKFLAINMPDFDADSLKAGSGQVIFIEGEGADFRPLQMTISPFPSADYINRVMEHLFTLGVPKIALAAGTAPYTGKVGAIQYQPFADLVTDLRIQWEVVMTKMISTIQEYIIDYFPELLPMMRESILNPSTGEVTDGEPIIREIEFDWENVLPLSRSDKVVDASTLRDRGAISLHSYLGEAGFRDPSKEIEKIKSESKDEELMAAIPKFQQFSPGVVRAQLDAQKQISAQTEAAGEAAGMIDAATTPKSGSTPAPILNASQNDGKRGVLSGSGTPSGSVASAKGAVDMTSQNSNAQAGY